MTPAQVLKQIEQGSTGPLYLLEGADRQSRQELAQAFAAMVEEGLEAFNLQAFYANEATTATARDQLIGDLLTAARTLPMMAPRRVLVVHEAERLLSPRKAADDEGDAPPPARPKGKRVPTPLEELERYLESPEPTTTMVFAAGTLDGNRRLVKLARKHATVVACGTLTNEIEAHAWVQRRLAREPLAIEPKALRELVARTGFDLARLRAEVDKLALYAAGQGTIGLKDVAAVVVAVDEAGEGPAMGLAIRQGNAKRALHELTVLLDNGAPHLPILGQIRWAAGGLQPATRVQRAFDLVLETDLAMKSSTGEPRYLLERLVIELCTRR